jgi:acyl-coenzyme A synthetase/AMP-(fatty) acid ligase
MLHLMPDDERRGRERVRRRARVQLAARTPRVAHVLAGLGVVPGERVSTLLGRVPEPAAELLVTAPAAGPGRLLSREP